MARMYLGERSMQVPDQVCACVAVLSFGIPRDVIRGCDEVLAVGSSGGQPTAGSVLRKYRSRIVALAYEGGAMTFEARHMLSGAAADVVLHARGMIGDTKAAQELRRLAALTVLIAALEETVDTATEEAWRERAERIFVTGNVVPVEPIDNLERLVRDALEAVAQPADPSAGALPIKVIAN